MVSHCDRYGIAMRLVAGTRPATTLAALLPEMAMLLLSTLLLLLIVIKILLFSETAKPFNVMRNMNC